jgi:hypothetical protein
VTLILEGLSALFSRRKKKLRVYFGELEDERESLPSFLRKTLKVEVTSHDNDVLVDSEELSPQELRRLVSKFVYHQRLNNRYWVSLEGDVVKIGRFKEAKKSEKRKKVVPPSTIRHGW